MKSMVEQLLYIPTFSKNEMEKFIDTIKDNQLSSTNVSPDNWIKTADILAESDFVYYESRRGIQCRRNYTIIRSERI